MGDVIIFKPKKRGTRIRTTPQGLATILIFTGIWHEAMNDSDTPGSAMPAADTKPKRLSTRARRSL